MAKLTGDREFGRRLERMLDRHELTQKELANEICVTESQVCHWIAGRYGITLHSLRLVKRALRCSWKDLLGL